MLLRKWIVRGIVWGIVAACAAGALAYQRWTNPAAVREQVIAEITKAFPGAHVSVDSARLHILGYIQVNGLRLTRMDDPGRHEFLHVPSAIFYHDKEKILDGELRLRKIELVRPRLRVRRGPDGKWNLQDIVRKADGTPQTHLPAIIIHQGTVILEDRSDPIKAVLLEINDVGLALINDAIPRITLRGAANSATLGKLHVHGFVERTTGETFVSFRAADVPLTQTLVGRLPMQCPPDLHRGLELRARAEVNGKLSYHPGQAQPMYYDIHLEINDGKLQHPNLPLSLDWFQLKAHCNSGALQLESFTARSGATEITAHGRAQLPCIEQEFEVHLDLKHVMLGEDLASRLPTKIRNLHKLFEPNGPTSIHIACARQEGQWVSLASGEPSMVSLRPEYIGLRFKGFPYPLERAKGDVDYNLLNQHVNVNLLATAANEPLILKGHWRGDGAHADVDFDIETKGNGVPIDDTLLKALPDGLRDFVASFHATGKIDVRAHIDQKPGKEFRNEYHIHIHDAAVRWDHFPYPLRKVSGFVDVYPEHWEFHDFQGTHRGGHVLLNGKSIPRIEKGEKAFGVSLEITGRNVPLDKELHDALRPLPGLYNAWDTFNPTGQLFFTASVRRPSADLNDLEVEVDARGANTKPGFFPYRVQDINGNFRFHKMRLNIAKLRAKHETALIALDHGTVDLNPRGGYYADFKDLDLQGMRLDHEFLDAIPKGKLQDAARSLKLEKPIRVTSRVIISQPPETGKPPDVYWDGEADLYAAQFTAGMEFANVNGKLACVGRYNGRQLVGLEGNFKVDQAYLFDQPFKNAHARFQVRETSPDVLLIGLRAPIFGGDVVGQVRVNFNSALDYELNMTASQINLAEFGRHNLGPRSQLSGAANGRLYLKGLSTGMESLEGNGSVDVPRGHLYNLPHVLDLLKFLGQHSPDRTPFEEFHAGFGIQGSKVTVQRLDLVGRAITLAGKGDIDLHSKKVELDVYPMWGGIEPLLPPVFRPVPTTIGKNLLTVEVRGKMSGDSNDLKFRMKPMPVIVDPVLLLRDRMLGQPSTNNSEPLVLPRDRK